MTPTYNSHNKDGGYELPGCWIVTMKKLWGWVNSNRASAIRISASTSAPDTDGVITKKTLQLLTVAV